jgi:hypothetical protein
MTMVFALFTAGYILGVWTACLVLRQPQRGYEAGMPDQAPSATVSVMGDPVGASAGRW